jgi:hypothetical protein
MQEPKINPLGLKPPKSLLEEIIHASKRFFLPIQNINDSISMSKSLTIRGREALRALRRNLNACSESLGSPQQGFDSKLAPVAPSKYAPLRDYLRKQHLHEFELTFDAIEEILGGDVRLPKGAERPQWWANQAAPGRPQREAWRAAGYDAFLVKGSRKVKFRKVSG